MTQDHPRAAARAFVSYARADGEAFATNLRLRLEREHPEISLWQDRARMEGGIGWWKQITDALEHVQILIMVMTPAAAISEVARKEWRYARQQGARVCPVIGDPGLDFTALPSWMRKVHFYDLAKTVMTPDGSRAISMSRDRTVRVWDLQSGKALLAARRAGYPGSATSFLDIDMGKVLDILRASVTRDSLVALSADGKRFVFTCGSALMVWDLESGSTREFGLGDFEAVSLVIDPAGRVAVLGSRFGAVGLCDLDRELSMRVLTGHTSEIRDALITADRRAVTASRTALRSWDLDTGRELSVWEGHLGQVRRRGHFSVRRGCVCRAWGHRVRRGGRHRTISRQRVPRSYHHVDRGCRR